MTAWVFSGRALPAAWHRSAPAYLWPGAARALLLLAIAGALAAGAFTTDAATTSHIAAQEGGDWTRLLRGMALLKAAMAAGATAAVLWRLGGAVSAPWWAAYALACAAMWAGPGLIWGLAHIGLGALLLHGGLAATIVLVWRDPAVAARLAELVARRRAALGVAAAVPQRAGARPDRSARN
ncbi:MAG: hypothetical protein JOY63_11905 [Acetobacteraceae bacterium]|nr:hypothetical protein [Acetobacteraceae bacterium]